MAFIVICISSSGMGRKYVCSTFAACAASGPPAPNAQTAAKAHFLIAWMFMFLKTVLFRLFKHSTVSWQEVKPQIFGKY